jgi:hypothetical protein
LTQVVEKLNEASEGQERYSMSVFDDESIETYFFNGREGGNDQIEQGLKSLFRSIIDQDELARKREYPFRPAFGPVESVEEKERIEQIVNRILSS